MKRGRKLACAFALALMAAAAVAGGAEDRVAKAFGAWNAAFNRGDAKAVPAFYVSDAAVLPPSHDLVKGPAEIEKSFSGVIGSAVSGHALDPIRVVESRDLTVVASKWSANGKDDKGNAASFGGIATHVFRKQADGSYKLLMHTFN